MVSLNLILKSLRYQKGLYVTWIVSLSLAVTGLVVIEVYRTSLHEMVRTQGRAILTADIALSARRTLTAEEVTKFNAQVKDLSGRSRLVETMAMVNAGDQTRLVQVRFIDDQYPLAGSLAITRGSQDVASHGRDLHGAWVQPDLLQTLGIRLGSMIKVGEARLRVEGVIKTDSSQTFRFGSLAPRIYVHQREEVSSKLIQFGSTVTQTEFALTSQTGLRSKIERELRDPALQITTPQEVEQGSLQVLSRLLDFLGLIGLVTLVMGWVGTYFLSRRWLTLEAPKANLIKVLGFPGPTILRILLIKLCLVLSLGVVLGGGVSWLSAKALLPWFRDSLPVEFRLIWSWTTVLTLILIGPFCGVLLLLEPIRALAYTRTLRPPTHILSRVQNLAISLSLVAGLFLILTFLQARSWKVTATFSLGLLAALTIIAGLSWIGLRILQGRRPPIGWLPLLTTAVWHRRPGTTLLLITVTALAGLLAQLVPNLERTIVGDFHSPQAADRPALFLFDVQDEQLTPLRKRLAEWEIAMSQMSPFIRGRILKVNDVKFERARTGEWTTREEENDARFRNRGVNLTYRESLSPSETILTGKAWDQMSAKPAEVSVETAYADRVGIHLGDKVLFDIQGIEITAHVASVRRIRWDSFEPNFFMQFPVGVLDDAPKSWIMTLKKSEHESAGQIQTLLAKEFSNVSSVNVQDTVQSADQLVNKLSFSLIVASRLTLCLGLFVILLILTFQLVSASPDWLHLNALGLSRSQIWWLQATTYGGLSLIGTFLGGLLSLGVCYCLAHFAFGMKLEIDALGMLQVSGLIFLVTFVGLGTMTLVRLRVQNLTRRFGEAD